MTLTKDDLIREYREHSASWPAIVGLYAVIVAMLFISASFIV